MGIEKLAADRKVKDETKKGRRKQRKNRAVQILYETCKEVFANCGPDIIPTPTDVERLKAVLDNMTEADIGVKPNMPFFETRENGGLPKITYLHLYECDKFSFLLCRPGDVTLLHWSGKKVHLTCPHMHNATSLIGIFCLPPSGVIPLHNHPGMTVFSKLLFGTMHIKSYDWVNENPPVTTLAVNSSIVSEVIPAEVRLAKVKVDADFTAPCDTSILYPTDGNMHCFTALTPCAVLDVLGPPYCDPDGRHCAYYRDFPFNHFSGVEEKGVVDGGEEEGGYVWLGERDTPEGIAVIGSYSGPKILI